MTLNQCGYPKRASLTGYCYSHVFLSLFVVGGLGPDAGYVANKTFEAVLGICIPQLLYYFKI